jgi:hypothetical protein
MCKQACFLLVGVLVTFLFICLLGSTTHLDQAGLGTPAVQPQVVSAAPAEPFVCDATQRGRFVYVDHNDDTDESFVCFCGVDADDATYVWLRMDDTAVNCF